MDAIRFQVFQNGDDAFLVWQIDEAIPDCLGFAVFRKRNNREEVVHSNAGFEDEKWNRGDHKPSTTWPIQKFMWTDYLANPGDTVSYRIVPMVGPDRLHMVPNWERASRWSSPVKIDPQIGKRFAVYFNRGIVATQWVQRLLGGSKKGIAERKRALDVAISDVSRPYARNSLSGELRKGLLSLLEKAKAEKLRVYAALFELADRELVDALSNLGANAYVVLADGAVKGKKKRDKADDNDLPASKRPIKDENKAARDKLRDADVEIHNRMTKGRFLAHNKLLVVCDRDGAARWIWTGSTNWTPSGLCTQANNGILIDDKAVADHALNYIKCLASYQGQSPKDLAKKNSTPLRERAADGQVTLWFTRTLKQIDLVDAKKKIANARKGILFLMFQTGAKGSLLEAVMNRRKDKGFYIHGVISSPPVMGGTKKGAARRKKRKLTPEEALAKRIGFVHRNERIRYAPDLLLPFAQENAMGGRWFREFVKKNGAHAIVHSKIVVIDPCGENPIVMTGSHNMGKTASQKNDENLVIIEGNKELAQAYAVNIMSIYNNYRWRYRSAQGSKWRGSYINDRWQESYLSGDKKQELNFWLA